MEYTVIMLDISMAFETVDHSVLLSRQHKEIGVSEEGYTCRWFESNITGRKHAVLIDGVKSTLWELLLGVPQGSVLEPLLFIIYMGLLGIILRSLGIIIHFYAEDSQICVIFNINESDSAVKPVTEAVMIIKN